MRSLLRGEMNRRDYCELLRNFHPLYVALERALEREHQHPALAPIYFPELFRARSIELDLDTLYGPRWREELNIRPTAERYVDHVRRLQEEAPSLLAAHAYVRYLGDLNGGQVLRKIVAGALKLADGHGTAFYDFGDKERIAELLRRYRDGLEAIPGGEVELRELVSEAKRSFELHRALFAELESNTGREERS